MRKEIEIIQVPLAELKLGMYVTQLDRPWVETPFLFQGFLVQTLEDIEELEKHCRHVYVDMVKSKAEVKHKYIQTSKPKQKPDTQNTPATSPISFPSLIGRSDKTQSDLERMFPHRRLREYQDEVSADEEMIIAKAAFNDLNEVVETTMLRVQSNHELDLPRLKKSVDPMVESVIRNPDACMWLARLKNRDNYAYRHSISASVWAVALGRQIGLPAIDLKHLALGSMLCDIGRLKLPARLLDKTGRLTDDEFKLLRLHVQLGVAALERSEGISSSVIQIVANHHERFNGSGYPRQLKGAQIPVLSRIAAIADCYDAMTSERIYASAISPSQAIFRLYEWRDIDFQAALVEEFIQAIGLYPAGTVVELSDGQVGIVTTESRSKRLRPKLLMLLDQQGHRQEKLVPLDLSEEQYIEGGIYITRSIEPETLGIDPQEYFFD